MKKIIRLLVVAMLFISLGLVLEVLFLTLFGFLLNLIASGLYIYWVVSPKPSHAPVRSQIKYK